MEEKFSLVSFALKEILHFFKHTECIPSMKSTPGHMKEISFTCSLVIN